MRGSDKRAGQRKGPFSIDAFCRHGTERVFRCIRTFTEHVHILLVRTVLRQCGSARLPDSAAYLAVKPVYFSTTFTKFQKRLIRKKIMDTKREREERSREKGFSKSESLTGLISLYRRCEHMHTLIRVGRRRSRPYSFIGRGPTSLSPDWIGWVRIRAYIIDSTNYDVARKLARFIVNPFSRSDFSQRSN